MRHCIVLLRSVAQQLNDQTAAARCKGTKRELATLIDALQRYLDAPFGSAPVPRRAAAGVSAGAGGGSGVVSPAAAMALDTPTAGLTVASHYGRLSNSHLFATADSVSAADIDFLNTPL